MNNINSIKTELNFFIKKYYKNKLLKGLLYCLVAFLLSLYIFSFAEFFGRFNSLIRLVFLLLFIIVNTYLTFVYCLQPIWCIINTNKRFNHQEASVMIGELFPEIADQLTNLLQLEGQQTNGKEKEITLLQASIEQKVNNIGFIEFSRAISYSENKKYLKYVLPAVFLFFIFLGFLPEMFTQGSYRVLNFSQEFKIKSPYSFELVNTNLNISEGEDLKLQVLLSGSKFPDKLYINSDRGVFLMSKLKSNLFETVLRKPKNNQSFFISSNNFKSSSYIIKVLGKNVLGKWDASIIYPSYLMMEPRTIKNSGDITIPEGSEVTWSGKTKNVSETVISSGVQRSVFKKSGFLFKKKYISSDKIVLQLTNSYTNIKDSLEYSIEVLKDAYPLINVEEQKDTINTGVRYFQGVVSDDYGLLNLNFHYTVKSKNGNKRNKVMNFQNVKGTKNSFSYSVDFNRENIALNDEILYFFSVSDNDGINGSKTTYSSKYIYELPSLSEFNEKKNSDQNEIKKDLNAALEATRKFQKDINELNKELKINQSDSWNKLNDINDLKQQQQELLDKLEQVQQKMDNSLQEKNQLSELDKELLEKQELLEELLNKVMDDELKKLLEELEELLKSNNQEKLNEKMEELDQSAEDMKKQLDRSLEMLKKLQVNEKIDDIEKELEVLAEKQNMLSKEKLKDAEEQEKIKDEFDKIKAQLKDLDSLNNKLETPLELEETNKAEDQIDQELNKANEEIEKNKKSKASKSQKSAADQMQELADKLDQMQQNSAQSQQEEDMDDLRKILEALIILSIDQENLMNKFINVRVNDPAFRKYGRTQRRINDDTKIIQDSLLSLAKRQPVLATFIDKELNDLTFTQKKSIDFVGDRNKKKVTQNQQSSMTSYNNLALLLNEVLQSMQAQMQMMNPGSGQCNKPGGKGKPKAGPSMNSGDMKEMLKNQLDQLKKGMKDGGKKEGGQKEGNKGENGSGGIGSKGLAKMAAEQSAIRKKLEQLRNQLNKDGKGTGNGLNPLIEEMKAQQKRIVNKDISNTTIKRQQEILTRLLESEKALIERGFDEKRESKSGKNTEKSNQILFNEYNKEKLKRIELLRFAEPAYRQYYKEKANEYFDEN
ncbi:MAG: hypothetical protein P8M87_03120 [Crocinitomicaceae bacterium]|nr:hypothetical protein [Crocinitomicaceae bacterium]